MKSIVAIQPQPSTSPLDIQVSGLRCFSERNWREAILYYLNGVWGGKREVVYRPKIILGDLTLRLNIEGKSYYAYRTAHPTPGFGERLTEYGSRTQLGETLEVPCGQNEVEIGLIRFVRNDSINRLIIHFEKSATFCLVKTTQRGEYTVEGSNLPTQDEMVEFYGL